MKCDHWTIREVGKYDNGEPTLALVDRDGQERMLGTLADFHDLLGERLGHPIVLEQTPAGASNVI